MLNYENCEFAQFVVTTIGIFLFSKFFNIAKIKLGFELLQCLLDGPLDGPGDWPHQFCLRVTLGVMTDNSPGYGPFLWSN